MKRIVVAATGAALVAMGFCGGAHAQLQGKFREKFIATQNDKCQTQLVNERAMSMDLATEACGCFVDYLADRVTGDKLALNYANASRGVIPPWLQAIDKDGANQCLINLKPVLHGSSSDAGAATPAQDKPDAAPPEPIPMGLPAGAPDGSGRPEECAKYTLKVATDPHQSICAR
jgi:hypothetical protein